MNKAVGPIPSVLTKKVKLGFGTDLQIDQAKFVRGFAKLFINATCVQK